MNERRDDAAERLILAALAAVRKARATGTVFRVEWAGDGFAARAVTHPPVGNAAFSVRPETPLADVRDDVMSVLGLLNLADPVAAITRLRGDMRFTEDAKQSNLFGGGDDDMTLPRRR